MALGVRVASSIARCLRGWREHPLPHVSAPAVATTRRLTTTMPVPILDDGRVRLEVQEQAHHVLAVGDEGCIHRTPIVRLGDDVCARSMLQQHFCSGAVAGGDRIHQRRPSAHRLAAIRLCAHPEERGDRLREAPLRCDEQWLPTPGVGAPQYAAKIFRAGGDRLREDGLSHVGGAFRPNVRGQHLAQAATRGSAAAPLAAPSGA
eukprot:CAMPEP_0176130750 /NCGR_PEP_ID=MMETSP0120_2-20121206/66162_1 /TAXON_ID=160619 /ORGANISM="Kryptoperidinium foliaceum, Strain CCMP 1326" /LENGTH=204 /DNA_ID=CAMNT_0017466057 /DNA_START=82 /DNA_END=697 /DNA_ORIENTATION=+